MTQGNQLPYRFFITAAALEGSLQLAEAEPELRAARAAEIPPALFLLLEFAATSGTR